MKIDSLDLRILKLLEADARQTLRSISKKLKTPISTIHSRIRKLRSAGVIKGFSVVLNAEKLGYEFKVIIGLNVKRSHLIRAEKLLAKKKAVICVYDVTGRFDLFLVARFKSVKELDRFLKEELDLEYIERTETFMVLKTWKESMHVC